MMTWTSISNLKRLGERGDEYELQAQRILEFYIPHVPRFYDGVMVSPPIRCCRTEGYRQAARVGPGSSPIRKAANG